MISNYQFPARRLKVSRRMMTERRGTFRHHRISAHSTTNFCKYSIKWQCVCECSLMYIPALAHAHRTRIRLWWLEEGVGWNKYYYCQRGLLEQVILNSHVASITKNHCDVCLWVMRSTSALGARLKSRDSRDVNHWYNGSISASLDSPYLPTYGISLDWVSVMMSWTFWGVKKNSSAGKICAG